MKPCLNHRLPVRAILTIALSAPVLAQFQESPRLAESTGDDTSTSEVFVLEEYRVVERADQFKPEETTGVFRGNTSIVETPYNVSVIQSDLLESFQFLEPDDAIGLVAGGVPAGEPESGTGGVTRLRGYAPEYFRNGVRRLFGGQVANLERTEYIKGSLGAMFGQAGPGGIVNYITKRPSNKRQSSAKVTIGDIDFSQFELHTTGPLIDQKLSYRLDLAHTYQEGLRDFYYNRLFVGSGVLSYRPNRSTSLTAEFEFSRRNTPTSSPLGALRNVYSNFRSPVTGQVRSGNTTGGISVDLERQGFNPRGPGSEVYRVSALGDITLEHRFNSTFSLKANVTVQNRPFDAFYWSSISYRPQTGLFPGRQPENLTTHIDLYQGSVDLRAKFNTGAVTHRALLTVLSAYEEHHSWTYQMSTTDRNALPSTARNLSAANPDWSGFDRAKITNLVDLTLVDTLGTSILFSDQAAFASGRLLLNGAYRIDSVDLDYVDVVNPSNSGRRKEAQPSYTIGAIYKVLDNKLTLFASQSTGFNPVTTIDRGTNQLGDNETSEGFEYGLKGEILDGKLFWMAAAYRNQRNDIAQRNPAFDEDFDINSGIPEFLGSGVERVDGVDFEMAGNITKNLSISTTFSFMDARTHRFPDEPAREGIPLLRVPKKSGSFTARYRFLDGRFKGLSFGVAARFSDATVNRYGVAGSEVTGTGLVTDKLVLNYGPANSIEEVRPAFTIVDAFARYSFAGFGGRQTIGLNVRNIADREWFSQSAGYLLNGRQFRFSYEFRF